MKTNEVESSEVEHSENKGEKMSKMVWSKWFWDTHYDVWEDSPLWMEGAWNRVLRRLYKSDDTGTARKTIDSWSKTIRCSIEDAAKFMKYLDANDIANLTFHSREECIDDGSDDFSEEITITCRKMKVDEEAREDVLANGRKRSEKQRKSEPVLEKKRLESYISELKTNYPSHRASKQGKTLAKELKKILTKARSEKKTLEGKIKAEKDEIGRILARVEEMKLTEEWGSEGGRYVQGLGNFVESRCWDYQMEVVVNEFHLPYDTKEAEEKWGDKKCV